MGAADRFAAVDENVAANLREHREARGLSQEELAQRMIDRGFGFSQATIWKIEQGKRPVKISEVVALADAIGLYGWTTLAHQPPVARRHRQVQDAHRRVGTAYTTVKDAATAYLKAQIELAVLVHEATTEGVSVNELWTSWLGMPAERAVIEARIEFEQDDTIRMQLHDAVDRVLEALRDQGFEAIIDPNAIETVPSATPDRQQQAASATPTATAPADS